MTGEEEAQLQVATINAIDVYSAAVRRAHEDVGMKLSLRKLVGKGESVPDISTVVYETPSSVGTAAFIDSLRRSGYRLVRIEGDGE